MKAKPIKLTLSEMNHIIVALLTRIDGLQDDNEDAKATKVYDLRDKIIKSSGLYIHGQRRKMK